MQPDLSAARTECGRDPLIAAILPVGIAGSEALFPIDESSLNAVRIEVRIGPAIDADALRHRSAGNRQIMMDSIGRAIAAVLPPAYRGAYASPAK